jgi:dihydrofolate reductase
MTLTGATRGEPLLSLSIIYARSQNHCIGHQGKVPWQLPAEYASFDEITCGHAIIMGRRSYEDHQCALPRRLNIVISRQQNYRVAEGVILVNSLEAALLEAHSQAQQAFIIGGVSLILSSMPHATAVFETVVDAHIDGDTFIPPQNFSQFSAEVLLQRGPDADHAYGFTVHHYRRPAHNACV